jgi:FlaA1/EpsC-like NDP-sugar epimerase
MERSRWLDIHGPSHLKRIVKDAVIDLIVVYLAYTAAFSVRSVTATLDYGESFQYISVFAVLMIFILYSFGVYHRLWGRTSGHGVVVLVNAVAITTVIVTIITLVVQPRPLPLSVIWLANVLSLIGFVAIRYRSRLITGVSWRWQAVWYRKFPKPPTRVLIIGAGEAGQELAWRLKYRSHQYKYIVVGFVDDDREKHGMYVEGSRVLGGRSELTSMVEQYNIDLIVVAIHNIVGADFRNILTLCEATKARIKVIPDLFELVNANKGTGFLRDVQPEDLIGRSVVSRHEAVDLSPITRKTILVTGAAGSIGSELSRQIMLYEPTKVILLDNNESGLHDLAIELASKFPKIQMTPVLADITVQRSLDTVFSKYQPQIVFHAAAYKHVPLLEDYPGEAIRANIFGTLNLAQSAQKYAIERFVLISTDKAVKPSSVMGASKRICELVLYMLSQRPENTTLFTAVRFGNVLGSRGSVVPTFNRQIDNGGPVTVTHKDMTRYFMSIPEAVNLVIHAACMTEGKEIFILKMGEVVRIVELAERMIRLRGLRPYKDIDIKFTGIRPGEKMHEELFESEEVPTETLHPGIIQIGTWNPHFEETLFLRRVNQLLETPLSDRKEVLTQLRALIEDSCSSAVAAD